MVKDHCALRERGTYGRTLCGNRVDRHVVRADSSWQLYGIAMALRHGDTDSDTLTGRQGRTRQDRPEVCALTYRRLGET